MLSHAVGWRSRPAIQREDLALWQRVRPAVSTSGGPARSGDIQRSHVIIGCLCGLHLQKRSGRWRWQSWIGDRPIWRRRSRFVGRVAAATGPALRSDGRGRVAVRVLLACVHGGHQDPVSSRRWQLDLATACVAGRGRITAEFFDIGYSREVAWNDRPAALVRGW